MNKTPSARDAVEGGLALVSLGVLLLLTSPFLGGRRWASELTAAVIKGLAESMKAISTR